MQALTRVTTIWPHPTDLLKAGSKLFLDMLITRATESMGHDHIQLATVDPLDVIEKIVSGNLNAVLKREFSSHEHHVFSRHTHNPIQRLQRCIENEKQTYGSCSTFPQPKWFIQPYLPPLVYLGEIRAFLVNGILFRSLVTTPKFPSFYVQELSFPTPLSLLRSVLSHIYVNC